MQQLIVNDICCTGVHRVKEYYHLNDSVEAAPSALDRDGRQWELKNGGERMNMWGSGIFRSHRCIVSSRYNQLSNSSCLVKESSFTDHHTNWTCLGGSKVRLKDAAVYQSGNPLPAEHETVSAKEFVLSEQESWILLVWNRETFCGNKLYKYRDIQIYAKAAVIHCKKGKRTLYRLRI